MKAARMQDEEKWKDRGFAVVCMIGLWIVLAVCFDFYYDLNDDSAMKDILSGTYTGVPDGHNIQMLYPLGWGIAFLYRICPVIPWYGIFLCGCQFFVLEAVLCRLIRYEKEKRRRKSAWIRSEILLFLFLLGVFVLFLYEFVFLQYTVTAGLLVCGGLVWIFSGPKAGDTGFYRYHIMTVVWIVLAFFLRTEMLLLLSPFLGLAVLCRAGDEIRDTDGQSSAKGSYFDLNVKNGKKIIKGYGSILLVTAVLMGAGLLADSIAYRSPQWQSFRQFFDDRTQVYDFYGLPVYEENREFYESLGLSEASYRLLENYNFELDETIDQEKMQAIARYAASHQDIGPARKLYLSVYTYVYRFTHGQELLFDLFVVFSYFFLGRMALSRKNSRLLGRLALLFGLRTALWLFLLYRGRVPERITHPLYLAELVMLGLFFLVEREALQWKKYEISAILSLYFLLFLCTAVFRIQTVRENFISREMGNVQWQAWKSYCREHPEDFFYLDVYSTVAYSEKLFADISPAYRNFDLLGGWCVKSPIADRKRAAAGRENAYEDLPEGRAYFVTDSTKEARQPDFLISFYEKKGRKVLVKEVDRCGDFAIYQVETAN